MGFHVSGKKQLLHDLSGGVYIALVSLPVSMVCAQVAGLPPRYGLFGALLPPLVFALLTGTPQVVFGVDAAPAALIGALLARLGIASGSEEAVAVMPVIALFTALWLALFWKVGGGKFAKFISEPVLGGCVSGIGCTVILALVPKLFGGSVAAGEGPELLLHLFHELGRGVHVPSFALGFATVVVATVGRRLWPRVPMPAVLLVTGFLLARVAHIERFGIALFPALEEGLPSFSAQAFSLLSGRVDTILLSTLTVALVIASETLISTRALALEEGYSVNNQQELLAYAAGNFTAAFCGCCPVTGSIYRTRWALHYGVGSQWMAVSRSLVIALILLFGGRLTAWLPVPIVAGIVIACLFRMLEFSLAVRLWKIDRAECLIFIGAFLAEMLGLMAGVLAGVLLSFVTFTMRATQQPREFLGCLEGQEGFFSLAKTPRTRPIRHTLLYQFSGPLFFASIDGFQEDISRALQPDTRLLIVTGITGVDITAAERLLIIYRALKERGIAFYLAGHARSVNEQLIAYGAEVLIQEGAVKHRLTQALSAGGLQRPYPLEGERTDQDYISAGSAVEDLTWAYGKYAKPRMKYYARRLAEELLTDDGGKDEALTIAQLEAAHEYWNSLDEEEFLELLETCLSQAVGKQRKGVEAFLTLERGLLDRYVILISKLLEEGDVDSARRIIERRTQRARAYLRRHPEAAAGFSALYREYMDELRRLYPEMRDMLRDFQDLNEAEAAH